MRDFSGRPMIQTMHNPVGSTWQRGGDLRLSKALGVRQCGLPSSTRPNLFSGD